MLYIHLFSQYRFTVKSRVAGNQTVKLQDGHWGKKSGEGGGDNLKKGNKGVGKPKLEISNFRN